MPTVDKVDDANGVNFLSHVSLITDLSNLFWRQNGNFYHKKFYCSNVLIIFIHKKY